MQRCAARWRWRGPGGRGRGRSARRGRAPRRCRRGARVQVRGRGRGCDPVDQLLDQVVDQDRVAHRRPVPGALEQHQGAAGQLGEPSADRGRPDLVVAAVQHDHRAADLRAERFERLAPRPRRSPAAPRSCRPGLRRRCRPPTRRSPRSAWWSAARRTSAGRRTRGSRRSRPRASSAGCTSPSPRRGVQPGVQGELLPVRVARRTARTTGRWRPALTPGRGARPRRAPPRRHRTRSPTSTARSVPVASSTASASAAYSASV